MQHLNGAPRPHGSATRDLDPVVSALRDQELFTRDQVAWLMSLAGRWGYETRVDEENHGYPSPKAFCAGDVIAGIDQKAYRAACDVAARLPQLGDHPGGSVTWDEDMQAAA